MKTYAIYDATRKDAHEKLMEIEAGNGKSALRKFQRNHCMNSGMYEIHKVKANCWEMSSTYGSYFYATPIELGL